MGRQNMGSKALGWFAGAALAAAAPMLAGCQVGMPDNGAASPSASSSASAGTPTSRGDAMSPSADGSSPEAVVAKWVTATVDGDAKQACSVMARPATATSPAQPASAQMCAGKGQLGQQMLRGATAFRESFTPKHATSHPAVRVSPVPVHGNTAVVPAKDITVGGQPLNKIILSHSTGIKPGQFRARVDATRIGGTWYVTTFDLNVGGNVNVGGGSSGSH